MRATTAHRPARDRDKLRQALLEGLGWTLHRIWSTDWWENRERETEELLSALEAAAHRQDVANVATTPLEQPAVDQNRSNDDAPETRKVEDSNPKAGDAEPELSDQPGLQDLPMDPAARVQSVLAQLSEDSSTFANRLEPYRLTTVELAGSQQEFYEPTRDQDVAQTLREVVACEGPVLAEVAAKRVGELWGFQRLKAKGVGRVLGLAGVAGVHITEPEGERVLWVSSECASSRPVPRVGLEESTRRAADQTPLPELTALLEFWLDEAGPMPEQTLLGHAMRSLGAKKLGQRIRERMELALTNAVNQGRIRSENGVTPITREASTTRGLNRSRRAPDSKPLRPVRVQ